MKISELKENEKVDVLEVKIIWDRSKPKDLNENFKHGMVRILPRDIKRRLSEWQGNQNRQNLQLWPGV